MTRKAIIVGAGIAGQILAIQLKEIRYSVEIFETRKEQPAREGLFMGLTPNGLNVLKHFVDVDLLKKDFTTGSMQFYNQASKLIATMDNGYQKDKYGFETIQIKRHDLRGLVKNTAREKEVVIHFNKTCTTVFERENDVMLTFDDGSQATADILFGADGTFSAVRNAIFPQSAEPEYTRAISTGGYARLPQMSNPLPAIQMIFGERGFFAYNVSNNGEIWWFNNYYRKEEPDRKATQSIMKNVIVADLLDIHKNDDPLISEILKASHDFIAYPIYDIPALDCWHRKRVCLLRDAAHAIAPHSGQGASLALEDTMVLTKCLKETLSPEAAFANYQQLRKPRVEKIIKGTRKIGSQKSKANRLAT